MEVVEVKQEFEEDQSMLLQRCRICLVQEEGMFDMYDIVLEIYGVCSEESANEVFEKTIGIFVNNHSRFVCSNCFCHLKGFLLFRHQAETTYREILSQGFSNQQVEQEKDNRCRICFNDCVEKVGIFSVGCRLDESKSKTYCEMFEEVTGLSPTEDDELPSILCGDCAENLKEFCQLRKQAEESSNSFMITKNINDQQMDYSIVKIEAPEMQCTSLPVNVYKRNVRDYACKLCSKTFTTYNKWKSHALIHTERRHICHICAKKFYQSIHLKDHVRSHTNERPYACLVCGKAFKSSSTLKKHSSIHSDVRPFTCPDCPKAFRRAAYLDSHRKSIHMMVKYECPICLKTFGDRFRLKYHMRTHANIRNYVCGTCNKTFTNNSHLNSHLRTHIERPTYDCELCSASYKFSSNLKNHIKKCSKHLSTSDTKTPDVIVLE